MIYWLFEDYFSKAGLGFRIFGTGLLSFLIVIIFGPKMIRFLLKKKIGDNPDFDNAKLNEMNRHKANVPTMGGVLIVISIFVSVVFFANLTNLYIGSGLLGLVWLGGLGAWDDWLKLKAARDGSGRDGLRSHEKLLFQIGIGVLLGAFVYKYGVYSRDISEAGAVINPSRLFYLPFKSEPIPLNGFAYTAIMVFVMTAFSNAVNLTDGMDGLATGCTLQVTAVLIVFTWIVGVVSWGNYFNMPSVDFASEMTLMLAAIFGACLGFLWYNAAPASVYMGDTGSLALGGMLGYIAVVIRQEVVLFVAGGVFVMETLSVMLQVSYFKYTRKRMGGVEGKRLFKCTPIHHHFHMSGWKPTKVVIRFWILGILFAMLALGTLKLR